MYGEGISIEGEILDIGSELDIVEKSGAWYSYNGERLGQGRENAKQFLIENPEMAEEILTAIRSHYQLRRYRSISRQKVETEEAEI